METYDRNFFHLLPTDVLEYLIHFLDVPTIGALSQTSKASSGSVSHTVSSEATWLRLINKRFNLGKSSHCRPKLYGGQSWKTAYRSLASCNRLPKMRVAFKKKNVFAKGAGFATSINSSLVEMKGTKPHTKMTDVEHNVDDLEGADFINHLMTSKKNTFCASNFTHKSGGKNKFVSSWVMINHTEDCTLRTTNLDADESRWYTNTSGRSTHAVTVPYIELQVAFQSTKSGFCTVNIDASKTTVQMMHGSSIVTQRIINSGPLKPRILYQSIGDNILYYEGGVRSNRRSCSNLPVFARSQRNIHSAHTMKRCNSFHSLSVSDSSQIVLRPFEFVIVSMSVPLTHYVDSHENIRFETDFLSRAISICTPVSLHGDSISGEGVKRDNTQRNYVSSLSVAVFLAEHGIWEHYNELPGNCLALSNRNTYSSV